MGLVLDKPGLVYLYEGVQGMNVIFYYLYTSLGSSDVCFIIMTQTKVLFPCKGGTFLMK